MNDTHWNETTLHALFEKPYFALLNQAYNCHLEHFQQGEIECCALCSIKTGACPEDCAYCPQSGHYNTGLSKEKLLDVAVVVEQARQAKDAGATRFCMGAAWRNPPKKELPKVIAIIKAVKALGLETCATLGMLNQEQSDILKEAGLDYYNHNLDTSPEYYSSIITTRNYQQRLDTLETVANSGLKVCCGGILGMGETREDRIALLLALKTLKSPPQSIPINQLIPIPGTPLANAKPLDPFEFVKTIAITRLMFPTSMIRLSAGREAMSEELQAWCFMAGANSIFIGEKLLTAKNPSMNQDKTLFQRLGLTASTEVKSTTHAQ